MKRALDLFAVWPLLPTFRAVAEHQHLSDAAAELEVTPAAVSRTIAKLEALLGVSLFERLPRGMLVTEAGIALLGLARESMRRLDDVVQSFDRTQRSTVRVAFTTHSLAWLLGHTVQQVPLRELRSSRLDFVYMIASGATRALLAGDIDVVLSETAGDNPNLVYKAVASVPCVVVTALTSKDITFPPSVGPLLAMHCSNSVRVPSVVQVPTGCRKADGGTMQVWRITRTRPSKSLQRLARLLTSGLDKRDP